MRAVFRGNARLSRAAAMPTVAATVALLVATATAPAASAASATLPLTGSAYVSAKGGCGTIPNAPVTGGSSVVNTLPAAVRAAYAGYPAPVVKSPWLNFKPRHKKPWTVDFIISNLDSPFQVEWNQQQSALLEKYKKAGYIKSFKTVVTGLNPTAEVQATQQALTQGVDLIIASPLSPTAFAPVAATAKKDDVPIVAALTTIPGNDVVSVQENPYINGGATMAGVARQVGGKGSVLEVHGIAGVAVDTQAFVGAAAALKRCPNMSVAGTITGDFSYATAKTATIEFLNTHPGSIAGVFSSGVMGPGIIQGFQQAGRPVAPLAEGGAQIGSLAYWSQNKSWKSSESGQGAKPLADAVVSVAMRILDGRGPLTDQISVDPPMITSANLSQWTRPGATVDTPGTADGPAGNFADDSYLNNFFKTPGAVIPGLNNS